MSESLYEFVDVSKVSSSSNDKDTKAENVLDGNQETKWSARGDKRVNPSLTIDLGEQKNVSGIQVKFYEGDIRRQQYTLYYSATGEEGTFRRIGTAVSSGNDNNEYEENVFDRPINGRFLKIEGEGNSLNSFISIVDLKVLGARKPQDETKPQELIAGDIKTPELVAAKEAEATAGPNVVATDAKPVAETSGELKTTDTIIDSTDPKVKGKTK